MTERKFTDEEVIKALELCSNKRIHCDKCLYSGKILCISALEADALDLINRQKKTIARQQLVLGRISDIVSECTIVEGRGRYTPIKNTSRQDAYRALYKVTELVGPCRASFAKALLDVYRSAILATLEGGLSNDPPSMPAGLSSEIG